MRKILSAIALCLCLQLTADVIDSWSSPPETVSSPGVNASNPCVGMDGNGNVVAAWLEEAALMANTLPVNGSWGTAYALSESNASEPSLVVDPAGNATVIWVQSGVVMTAFMPVGSTWGVPQALSGTGSSSPQISVRPNGDLAAIWVTNGAVQAAMRSFDSSWSAVSTLASSGGSSPQIGVGSGGTVVAVWHSVNPVSSISNINSAVAQIGGTFSTASIISDPSVNSDYPQVAVDSNGNALAIWFSYSVTGVQYTDVVLQSSTLPMSSSWSTPVKVSSPGRFNPATLMSKVLFTQSNSAVAIWTNSFGESFYGINSSQTTDRQNWDAQVTLAYDTYAYSADVAVNSISDAFGIYMSSTYGTFPIAITALETHVATINNDYWSNANTLSGEVQNAFPRIAAVVANDPNAYAVALWVNFDGTNTSIQSSVATGTLVIPPSNVTVSQSLADFGVFQEYLNTISWDASSDPNLYSYAIFRNGALLNVVDSSSLSYIDNNQVENGSVTYGVTAIDNTGNSSLIVNVSFP